MTNKDYAAEQLARLARYFEVNNVAVNEDAEYAARMALEYFADDLAERDAEIERLKSKQEAMQMTITTQMRHLSNARILSSVIAYMVDRLRNDEEVPEDIVQGSWDKIVEMGYQRP